MEELRETALAYYVNLSENQKREASNFFRRMDADGNGYVSINEFMAFIPQELSHYANMMFKMFDKDGNGFLDFEEVITFYYILATERTLYCDGCGDFLKGVYFTCCQCFRPTERCSFDLCCTCFRRRNFTHHADAIFYDNFTLLRSNRLAQTQNRINSSHTSTTTKVIHTAKAIEKGVEAIENGVEAVQIGLDVVNIIGNISAAGCNIM